jgi:hypothetical protein
LDGWIDALLDDKRGDRALATSLFAYMLAWTLYRVISTLPRGINFDMSELYVWSRDLAWGYAKHPPFSAAVVRVWFTALPVSDVTFSLLATANIALTLWIIFKICRRFMPRDKAVFGVALMTLVPFFNFHSLKYNANSVMLPLWAATIYFFLRAYEARSALFAVLTGIAAAAAMLGKYWSAFLLAGLGIAALIDRRRAAFFRSPAPWLITITALALFAPHLAWLAQNDFPTLTYASGRILGTYGDVIVSAIGYLVGSIGYVLPAVIVALVLLRRRPAAVAESAWPADDNRRLAVMALALPLVLPALVAPVTHLKLNALWSLPNFALLPVVLLSSPLIGVTREALRGALGLAALLTLGALALSPAIALALHLYAPPHGSDYASVVADDVAAQWREISDRPVPFVSGEGELAMSVAYYLRAPAGAFIETAEPTIRSALADRGGVIVCPSSEAWCLAIADRLMAPQQLTRRVEVVAAPSLFGFAGQPIRYVLMLSAPLKRS